MSTDSENMILQLKNDIAELKKTISVKNKTKDQACQTLVEDKVHIFKQIQTDSVVKENYDKNTQTDKIGRVHIAIQNNVEDTNEEETASSNYEKKSLCMACFNDHTVKFPLDWPSRQYYFSKYLPISADQYEWPDKSIIDNYIEDFANLVTIIAKNALKRMRIGRG